MSENTELEELGTERLRNLAQKLRAMFKESNPAKNPNRRPITHLFGIAYADDLKGLEDWELRSVASQAGLPHSYRHLIKDGRELAHYVGVCRNSTRMGTNTDKMIVISVWENAEEYPYVF